MNQPVVMSAQEDQVLQAGRAAIGPVNDVVRVGHHRRSGAVGEPAVLVASDECPPDGGRDEAAHPPDVEHLGVGSQHSGDDLGVARHASHGRDSEVLTGLGGP
jgi:hypothetical protein